MAELEGNDAFAALAKLLSGEDAGGWMAMSPSLERLRVALVEQPRRASGLDLAVLLRQVLRFEQPRRGYMVSPSINVGHPRFAEFDDWARVGLDVLASSNGRLVSAHPWRPTWLHASDGEGVDANAASEAVCRQFNCAGTVGDLFLRSLAFSTPPFCQDA